MEGEGSGRESRVGVRKRESVREAGPEGQMGVPSPGQGWPHTLPLRSCSEAQGAVPWDSPTICSGFEGC